MIKNKNAIPFEIVKNLATLGDKTKNYYKQVNIIKWNSNDEKYDIRTWDCDGNPGKGVCLKADEAIQLMHALQKELRSKLDG